jgi:hypothetical protein
MSAPRERARPGPRLSSALVNYSTPPAKGRDWAQCTAGVRESLRPVPHGSDERSEIANTSSDGLCGVWRTRPGPRISSAFGYRLNQASYNAVLHRMPHCNQTVGWRGARTSSSVKGRKLRPRSGATRCVRGVVVSEAGQRRTRTGDCAPDRSRIASVASGVPDGRARDRVSRHGSVRDGAARCVSGPRRAPLRAVRGSAVAVRPAAGRASASLADRSWWVAFGRLCGRWPTGATSAARSPKHSSEMALRRTACASGPTHG